MSGPQVIEVVVIDSDIDDTDEAKGEPDVTINGKIMRMVQAVDGNWYGYFADRDQAQIADSTVAGNTAGQGLDFGNFCDNTSNFGIGVSEVTFTDTVGIAIGGTNGSALADGSSTGGTISGAQCAGADPVTSGDTQNVIREEKDINPTIPLAAADGSGQIGLDPDAWPFIQLYPLNPTGNVVIQYNKGGGAQTTTLTFDTVEGFAGIELDRAIYPNNAEVHVTVTDLWLNIDPTDEDSWTWGTNSTNSTSFGTYYQVFNENGGDEGAAVAGGVIEVDNLGDLMCEDNCILILNVNAQSVANDVVTLSHFVRRTGAARSSSTCTWPFETMRTDSPRSDVTGRSAGSAGSGATSNTSRVTFSASHS